MTTTALSATHKPAGVIETHHTDAATECGYSFTSHNPEPDDYVRCASEADAWKLDKHIHRIESALASAEPVATEYRRGIMAAQNALHDCANENRQKNVGDFTQSLLNKLVTLYVNAQPAAKVEAPRKIFPPAAFEEWFADIWAGTDGIPVPPYQGDSWDAYIEKRQLALGAWVAATEAAPTPLNDHPECSGDPASCPENEGHGCCKPNPIKTTASVPDSLNAVASHLRGEDLAEGLPDGWEKLADYEEIAITLNVRTIRAVLEATNQEGAAP